LLAALGYSAYRLVEWPGFKLQRLDVRGARVTPRDEIVRAAAIDARANIWLVNLGAARARIEALPYVRTAVLRRVPPATIAIYVAERAPDGCLEGADGARALIDTERRVLAEGCDARPAPVYRVATVVVPQPGAFVHDAALTRLQSDAHALEAAGGTYATLRHDAFGQLDATLASGVTVRFGDEVNLDAKARLVDPILRTAAERLGAVESLDLRAPSTPVVRYREAGTGAEKP
jgi:cell division protein FtsQ